MKRILLHVAYDGTKYHGWQIQPNAITIESMLNDAISDLMGVRTEVIGASRTDAGVHALDNLAVFDSEHPMDAKRYAYALNARLPNDIRIISSEEVDQKFHPRKVSTLKTYLYQIWNDEVQNPLYRNMSHFYRGELQIEEMIKASKHLIGEHDFKSFSNINTQAESTVRTVKDIRIEKNGNLIQIHVSGNGFLYNMVRIIVGTLIEVGRGKIPEQSVKAMLEACDRTKAGPTAPAQGLILESYKFL